MNKVNIHKQTGGNYCINQCKKEYDLGTRNFKICNTICNYEKNTYSQHVNYLERNPFIIPISHLPNEYISQQVRGGNCVDKCNDKHVDPMKRMDCVAKYCYI